MRNPERHGHVRLNFKHPGRLALSCGIFGACAAASLLSPTEHHSVAPPIETEVSKPQTTAIESITRWELPVARDRTTPPPRNPAGRATEQRSVEASPPPVLEEDVTLALVKALRDYDRPAVKALLALCLAEQRNRGEAVRAGAVEALLEVLPNLRNVAAERALATLDLLCTVAEGRAALRDHALAVPLLLEMIFKVSDRGTEYAVSVLCGVCACEDAVDAQETALELGALTQLLLLLQSDCTSRAKRKALRLLKLLHKA